ncbi:SH3 domain-containing protein [Xenophilus arseniciresistens]|uniref:SH3 domain-containing protein n=1 Tax=Xenophilus arseniciresistens TaxID=1283306 RepID=A0AAE3NA18_9BURK|nr:SH3 domain-containing protein [Xenophilus arseniciresistens]MDA7417563.1 SH3 domain-containing protein [Xenophilus arseniciresistens]
MSIALRRLPALFLVLATLFALPAAYAQQMVAAARDGVMLRAAASQRAEARWSIDKGYPLRVLSRKGAWLRVSDFEGDRAWVLSSRTNRQAHMVSKASALNVRATPNTRARVVARAGYGDVLRTMERRGDWVKVRTKAGRVGWVSRKLVWGW